MRVRGRLSTLSALELLGPFAADLVRLQSEPTDQTCLVLHQCKGKCISICVYSVVVAEKMNKHIVSELEKIPWSSFINS